MINRNVFEVLPFELSNQESEYPVLELEMANETYGPAVKPGSQAYNRWVQETLNRVLGLKLSTDGVIGAQTRSAIRSFQQKQGLTADGVVGPKTEAALKAALGSVAPAAAGSCAALVVTGFSYDSDTIPAGQSAVVDQAARCILDSQKSTQPIRTVKLVGHTDPVGSAVYNLGLGQRRAEKLRDVLRARLETLRPGISGQVTFKAESRGEAQPISSDAARNRRVEITLVAGPAAPQKLPELGPKEKAQYNLLSSQVQAQFNELRGIISGYSGVARKEADRGSRVLLERGVFKALPGLLPEVLALAKITALPSGWSLAGARPLLVGNVLYNLSFPETINQGGYDRLGGKPDPTCFSASTQILLARRYPVTYVRYVNQLAGSSKITFAGGAVLGPLTFVSTSLYKSLDAVLLQTAFDTYFNKMIGSSYTPGDELKVHRQVFGSTRPPKNVTASSKASMTSAFRKAFITGGGNTRLPEIINLCTGNPSSSSTCGNHSVVLNRITGGRVYFYNPWANEEERNTMFGPGKVSVSGNGERPAESSMTQADFENQLTSVFHN